MRTLIVAIFSLLVAGTVSAQAAQSKWACKGPGYACAQANASHAHGVHKKKKVHARAYKSGKRHYAKSRKHYAKAAYGKKRVAKRSTGRTYAGGHAMHGKASYYWQPQRVASGGWFNPNAMTAAHKTLPFGTRVSVTNLSNGRSVVVSINDRGPYIAGRIIDLSKAAAHQIGMQKAGVVPVRVTVLGRG
ncbi:MAG: septal ring lytic transglycosylase RlpA family protein [Hyphomicrobiaceae bacterium]|nr:septal ring lytic transglycosylase RlpA family protein [Hyphomicrobiaceae bacterium]